MKSLTFILFAFITCTVASAEKIKVAVSIPSQEYFANRIGGDLVEVRSFVRPDEDPCAFEPNPRRVAWISKADIYFKVGMAFENEVIEKFAQNQPRLKIVDAAAGITLLEEGHEHDHDGHHHELESKDIHFWLNPRLAMKMSENMLDTFITQDAAHTDTYRKNAETLFKELNALDQNIEQRLKPYAGKTFYVFHPAFSYYAQRYGLSQVAIQKDGKEPNARFLRELIKQAKSQNVKIIYAQSGFSQREAETIANEIGGSMETLNPLGEDYLKNMQMITDALVRGFEKSKQPE